ncbi:Secreted protein [Paramyrothecium foliicola]|nr:Secreted protein [Paramyrothecium foliicola]
MKPAPPPPHFHPAMILRSTILGASAAAVVHAAQPGAADPVPAPMRDLDWGKLNFLHTTDTHGWLGGHLQEPQYSADWGDYISFSEHLRKEADDKGVDLLLIDTGDRVEGNGLYDASTPKGLFHYDIFAEQKVDILCTGNHELYKAYSADREHNTTVPKFKDNYIASNLDYIDPKTGDRVPQAQRFRRFKTKNQGIDIIAFGFIFDFTGNADNTVIQKVEDTVKEKWFQDAIHEKPDVFVVTGHVGLRMDEFKTIFKAMRTENWDTPIIFFGGHAHVRDALSYGSRSFSLASGRYMETIGWLSVDGLKIGSKDVSAEASLSFKRRYIDNNLYGMYYHTGLNESSFPTDQGKKVSQSIARARNTLSLDHAYGCAPRDLWMNRAPFPGNESIYSWLQEEVLPGVVVNDKRKDKARLAIFNTGGIRFDIFAGKFTRDATYIVSPFTSKFKYVPDVPYKVASKVIDILNSRTNIFGHGPDTRFLTIPQQMFTTEEHVESEKDAEEQRRLELREVQEPLRGADKQPDLTYGYTTKDDIGTDGDDTVHEALKFYKIPNCIQSEIGFPEKEDPETVDLVFIDFILPWVIPALRFSGGDYTADDAKDYTDGTFTYKMADWISKNWKGDC